MLNSSISKGGPFGLNPPCKRLRVPFLVDFPEEAALNLRFLAGSADALLDQKCKWNIPKSAVRKSVEKAMDGDDLEKLQILVVSNLLP
jgi:hypothetical protein